MKRFLLTAVLTIAAGCDVRFDANDPEGSIERMRGEMSLIERYHFDRSYAAIGIGDDLERIIEYSDRGETIPGHMEAFHKRIDGMTAAEINALGQSLHAKQKAQMKRLQEERGELNEKALKPPVILPH